MDEATIQGWIERAKGGDSDASDEICRHFQARLQNFVERRMGKQARRWAEPADVVQRVLLETIGHLAELPEGAGEEDLLKRLYQTANWRIRDLVRSHQRDAGESILAEHGFSPGLRLETGSVTRRDTLDWLRGLMEQLPPEYAEVLELCAIEELSFVDAGRRLEVSADAVRKRFERAREALTRKVGEIG